MTAHRLVIEAGPVGVRRLCCGAITAENSPNPAAAAAVAAIDDPVALLDGQPVRVAPLWAGVLRSSTCPDSAREPESVLIVHPSWWSKSRVALVGTAARTLTEHVVIRPRAQLLTAAARAEPVSVVVEIAATLVAITSGNTTVAEQRSGAPGAVADAVTQRILSVARALIATVLVDGPDSVAGSGVLATMIAERLRPVRGMRVELVGIQPDRLAVDRSAPARPTPTSAGAGRSSRTRALLGGAVMAGAVAFTAGLRHQDGTPLTPPSTFLVEGPVVVQVPAQWPVRRIATGPGSPRVELVSPVDPQLALHVTQSPAPGGGAGGAVESLQRAFDQVEPGVFVDFDSSATSAGRPVVTYREVRPGRHIDWTVLVDGGTRIGIGCQHPPDAIGALGAVCEQAVRTARAPS